MSGPVDEIDRLEPTQRPPGQPAGFHRWSKLLFLHWPVRESELRPLVPEALTIDTFEGKAWIGLVLFQMSKVRPRWFPAIPGVSSFPEFNVRTYVHRDGADPGVWFFSLDAGKSLPVHIARWRWKLPYYRAAMRVKSGGRRVAYHSERLWPGVVGPGVEAETEFGDLIGTFNKDLTPGQATPGTLEHFLAERYLLYCQSPNKELFRGRVHHTPYPLREARVENLTETLLAASSITRPETPPHVLYSEGVEVEVFPLERV
ncbi:MAG: hypothetical protein CMJ48_01295 [Planctomycetaceae bacterium]|nr:hypothetical protein [Planctomycetaceae bacterium]